MIISISGAVGSGKTTISKKLSAKLGFELISLNEIAKDFKLEELPKIQTFDFDLEKLLLKVEEIITLAKKNKKDLILEGHFSHFISPKLVDKLFIINRDLSKLKKVYSLRNYNFQKQKENLEVESFNLCFYEGIEEGYIEEEQIFCIVNDLHIENLIEKIDSFL